MELKCSVCGKKFLITPEEIDFNKALKDPKYVYICTLCQAKLFHEAHEHLKPLKPM